MIEVKGVTIGKEEISESFIRCSGPGGQNVNKVNSGVQLRFNAAASPSLPEDVRSRLMRIAANRINKDGEIVITAQTHRNQMGNRQEAVFRLTELIEQAVKKPKKRKKTKISRAAKERRLKNKKHRSRIKQLRSCRGGKSGEGFGLPFFVHFIKSKLGLDHRLLHFSHSGKNRNPEAGMPHSRRTPGFRFLPE